MSLCSTMAAADKTLRPFVNSISPAFAVMMYSASRKLFLKMLANESLDGRKEIDSKYRRSLWEIDFYSPLMNAAGMFKHGDGYETAFRQGAGAFLAGTSTDKPRKGNAKLGVKHPFVSYPFSHSASNWMGLPNFGHADLARQISKIEKRPMCPIAVSISPQPDAETFEESAAGVVRGLDIYERTQADFIEINESCPNVVHDVEIDRATGLDKNLISRLGIISERFLKNRTRNLPVTVKFSNDTNLMLVPKLLDCLIEFGFDGVNFGNTSTDYAKLRPLFNERDLKTLDYFVGNFGGGLSGKILRQKSYELCFEAERHIKNKTLQREFHVFRTGGIENYADIEKSDHIGVSMNQWFTGYFEQFATCGHNLYANLFK